MNAKKQVIITGATGILGANIAEELSIRGYKVICLSRQNRKPEILKDIECEILSYNPNQPETLQKHINCCEYIIHAAAKTGQYPNKINEYLSFNLEFTKSLVLMCENSNIKRFIYISTANCFTNGTLQNPGNEFGGFMPWLKNSGYAWTKYLAQSYILEKIQKDNFPAIILAPTFLIGKRDNGKSSGKLVKHGKKKIIFYPPGGKSFIDAKLAAEAIVNSLTRGKTGEIYLLSGQNLTYREFFKKLADVNCTKKVFIKMPYLILKAIAWKFDLLNRLFNTHFTLDKINQRLLCLDNYFDNSKAKKELGLKDTVVEDVFSTLPKTL